VGTDDARKDALARWGALPKFVDTEIGNLREGIKLGYTAPKGNVRIVIDQMNTLLTGPIAPHRSIRPRCAIRRRLNSTTRW
jgi:uncharacterized protein (DUF885 family)